MAVNFRELLQDTSTSVIRPKSAPTCWLIGTLGSAEFNVTKGESETPYVSFEINNIERHPDTEEELLDGVNLQRLNSPFSRRDNKPILAVTYWLTPEAKYHLTNMLDRVVGDPERTIEERITETRGQRIMFKVLPATNRDGEDTGQNRVDAFTLSSFG